MVSCDTPRALRPYCPYHFKNSVHISVTIYDDRNTDRVYFLAGFFFGRGIFPRAVFFPCHSTFFFGGSKIGRLDSPGLSEAAVQQTSGGEGTGVFYVAQPPGAQAHLRRVPRVCELHWGMVRRAAAEVQRLTCFWAFFCLSVIFFRPPFFVKI